MHTTRFLIGALILLMATGVAVGLSPVASGQTAELPNFEGAQTNPLRLSPDGTRLFAVNTANASLSVFDVSRPTAPVLIREIPVGLEPVSANPRTSDEAWVVNQLSDSVSIVSVSRGIVTATLNIPDEPMDVVFAGVNQAYVSVSRSNAVAVFDTATRALTHTLPLFGGNPRALAVSPDGTRVYAAFALSGNGTTLLQETWAPPPPPPTNTSLPPGPHVGRIISAKSPFWSALLSYHLPDNDVAAIRAGANPEVTGYYSGVGTINLGLAVHPASGDLFVANTDARNLVRFEPNLRGHWVDNRLTRIEVATGRITPFDLNPNVNYSVLPNPAARTTALAQPAGVVFNLAGDAMYVAAFGTDRVAKVDTSGHVVSFVEVGPPSGWGPNVDPRTKRGPRGLALAPEGRTLYVLNRISNTISLIDTAARSVIREIRVGTDLTPLHIRVGRGFLYDAKLSGNGTGSCASCHVDGDMDHLAWDLGDPAGEMIPVEQGTEVFEMHPMKGPLTTQTLRGLAGLAPFHWRGEKANLMEFNPAFQKLMGGSQLSGADMLAFAAFVRTIVFQPNPNQNLDRSLPTSFRGGNAEAGRDVFINVRETRITEPQACNDCHTSNPGPGSDRLLHAGPKQAFKSAQLRNVYQKQLYNRFNGDTIHGFGTDHDGKVSTFVDFFASPVVSTYTAAQKADLEAFVLSFDTGTAPAVGYTMTLTADNVADVQRQADWATLEQQAQVRNIDLVVRGTITGQVGALRYRPSLNNYAIDGLPSVSLTRIQLEALIQRGDTLTVMGVPPRGGVTQAGAASLVSDVTSTAVPRRGTRSGGH